MQFFTRVLSLAAAAAPFIASAAPLASRAGNDLIPGKYIIQLKPDTDIASIAAHHNKVRSIHARNLARRDDGASSAGMEREFQIGDFKAYSGSFDDLTIEELKVMDEVLVVEQDYMMTISGVVTQSNAPPGLARLSSRANGVTTYKYDETAGQGTFSYVVDTGIRITHNEFGGRAILGFNAVKDTDDTDNEGHGTHVAGIIGGTTFGVAKKTTLVAVKVFDGASGSASGVISGFEWAVNDIVSKNRQNTAVINMSLGGSGSTTWDAAIAAAWAKGVLSVVAAGNENQLASNVSPGRSPEVICVGNVQSDDSRFNGNGASNFGDAVDIWAPGTAILSAYRASDSATARLTGTSMASPQVAGLVSYLRAFEGASSAADVKARVYALATPDLVKDTKGGQNLLAFNGIGGEQSFNGTLRARWF